MIAPITDSVWWLPLGLGTGIGLALTWLFRNLAIRTGLVDRPDGQRKTQTLPVPMAGGVAVLATAIITTALVAFASPKVAAALNREPERAVALLLAAVTITAVGVLDDLRNLRARHKLLGQVLASLVLVAGGGYLIERVSLFGWIIEFGSPLAVAVSVFWFLACINALNLIDGMDGLLGTVGLISLATFAVIALLAGQLFAAVVALALAGAVLGFLRFNLPPASVYMGDAGSMLIGLVVGALAISTSLKGPATVALICPVAILVLPVLDTTAAVVRRRLTGRSLATPDRGHLHHVLLRHGMTVRRALLIVATLGMVASGGALASTALSNDLYALVAALGVVAILLVTRLFGHTEFHLVRTWAGVSVRALCGMGRTQPGRGYAIRLQGTVEWGAVWAELSEAAGGVGVQSVSLDVNAPALHENYHARWDRTGRGVPEPQRWRIEIPLFGRGHLIGRVAIVGDRDSGHIGDQLRLLTRIIEVIEARVTELTGSVRSGMPQSQATHDVAIASVSA